MNIFIDTNIFLDVMLARDKNFRSSMLVIKFVELELITGYINPISLNNIWFISKKLLIKETVKGFLDDIIDSFKIVAVDNIISRKALNSGISDFEDSLQLFSALSANCEYLITRNINDFKKSNYMIKIITPENFLKDFMD